MLATIRGAVTTGTQTRKIKDLVDAIAGRDDLRSGAEDMVGGRRRSIQRGREKRCSNKTCRLIPHMFIRENFMLPPSNSTNLNPSMPLQKNPCKIFIALLPTSNNSESELLKA
jgi:hypothetical protein